MRSTDGEKLDRLLDEQAAYYRALATDYLDQGLDLPGGVFFADDAYRTREELGWHIKVTATAGPFCWGTGGPSRRPP